LLGSYIYSEVERIVNKYKTRDPYALLDAIGAEIYISYKYGRNGLKGFCAISNRIKAVLINGYLRKEDQRIAAGHEGWHLILHEDVILTSPAKAMKDFSFFDNSGRYEREANSALADFLVSDEDVLDVIMDEDRNYFSAASELYLPPPLFAFKLYSMMQRGHNVRNPVDLDSRFLGRSTTKWYE